MEKIKVNTLTVNELLVAIKELTKKQHNYTSVLVTDTEGFLNKNDPAISKWRSHKVISPVEIFIETIPGLSEEAIYADLKRPSDKNGHELYNKLKPIPVSVLTISEDKGANGAKPRRFRLTVRPEESFNNHTYRLDVVFSDEIPKKD